jgi:hypothetical protein
MSDFENSKRRGSIAYQQKLNGAGPGGFGASSSHSSKTGLLSRSGTNRFNEEEEKKGD